MYAAIAAVIGLLFFIASVGFLLVYQQSNISTVSLISGALIEFMLVSISIYTTSLHPNYLNSHNRLDITQRFLLANSICEGLEGDFKQKARSELINKISEIIKLKQN